VRGEQPAQGRPEHGTGVERGPEAFLLTILPSGEVLFEVRAFSRAGVRWSKVLGPVGRAVQRWVTARYLRALMTART
jgi:uncharacterized protein (UPF0548 family)